MIEELRRRNRAPGTIRSYVACVVRFANYFGQCPSKLGKDEVARFQRYLRDERKVSWSYYNCHVSALHFLYEVVLGRSNVVKEIPFAKIPRLFPVVLSPSETGKFLSAVEDPKHRVLLTTIYACGLRISEACNLRVADIDSQRMLIRVHMGKGSKDRYVPLGQALLTTLRDYYRLYRPGTWLFPGRDPSKPITSNSVAVACRKATAAAGLKKRVTPHLLRHGYATHLLEHGVDVHTIQLLLGHSSLKSTVHYIHIGSPQLHKTPSPLDLLRSEGGGE
jgi:site-specific recombinase XerD